MVNDKKDQIGSKKVLLATSRINAASQMHIIHKTVIKQLNERRQGNANCKTRSEVRGGGKKPWKQKGTGRARAGSNRSPLWRGGGVIFGPKTKYYSQKVNKKEKQLAVKSLLFNKSDFIFSINNTSFNQEKPKTKNLVAKIKELNIDIKEKILIITTEKNKTIYLASRNLKNVETVNADQLNALSIIKAKYVLAETGAIEIITRA